MAVHPGSLRPLVLACGALAADLRAVLIASAFDAHVDVEYLPANLHNRPDAIVPSLRPRLQAAIDADRPVFVAYADCGTGGGLDALLGEFPGVQRLPGAHCYEMFAGAAAFAALQGEEIGTFDITAILTKQVAALGWKGWGLDRHPELRDVYFGAYRRVVLLSQAPDRDLVARASAAAERLGLEFSHRTTGRDQLAAPVLTFADRRATQHAAAR
ncbi:MAG: hypothetical protein QOI44_1156 [Actinomycetota bacterium]|nr:hypothetical protein [Actinomycetota bacterium]